MLNLKLRLRLKEEIQGVGDARCRALAVNERQRLRFHSISSRGYLKLQHLLPHVPSTPTSLLTNTIPSPDGPVRPPLRLHHRRPRRRPDRHHRRPYHRRLHVPLRPRRRNPHDHLPAKSQKGPQIHRLGRHVRLLHGAHNGLRAAACLVSPSFPTPQNQSYRTSCIWI
jgi:hypothetical protein